MNDRAIVAGAMKRRGIGSVEENGGRPGEGYLELLRSSPKKIVQRPFSQKATVREQPDSIAQGLGVLQDVGGKEDRPPTGAQLLYQVSDQGAANRVETRHGFIQDEQLRFAHETKGHRQALPHSF